MRQIILDTETTGLSPEQGHRVIEVGALEMVNRRLTGAQFHYYIHPDREIDPGAQRVHGITLDFLQDKPRFHEIAEEFLTFVKDAELIIHNAPFDMGFLESELQHANIKKNLRSHIAGVIDTLMLARKKYPGKKNNLDALCKRHNIDNSARDLHGALLDSEILADVYLAMTGGQETLGWSRSENKTQAQQAQSAAMNVATDVSAIPVIRANDAELTAHQEYIALFNKEN
jgi:DNA polymerase-3 subunit epsilon